MRYAWEFARAMMATPPSATIPSMILAFVVATGLATAWAIWAGPELSSWLL
ncbi:hypothetical protein [Actinoplanes regularis]|uniref:Uncharacterized protein n=1 Tax=Actinoplanes regularis TaxID=52697 RepID=A0A239EYS6_9ACTN|nr:hypothetical protein [Actinoplanes regularis]GIE89729.1 hypothetical protein Are01nite_62090 [Actinoplanes regularis]SNS49428.1 hypothetical protein SAMN06264365_116166 [Actinoplanes regularis]